eukprot:COSAG02_NODE_37750_length_438_cov_0.610619_2_plen_22_part_01
MYPLAMFAKLHPREGTHGQISI